MRPIRLKFVRGAVLFVLSVNLFACASVTVTRVTDANRTTVPGQRYFLPKPIITVAPQPDGTTAVTVDYLPDRDHEYAIETSSALSSYSFQATTDIRGLLTQVQFGADTTAVAQQAASSVAGAAVQLANTQSQQLVAQQTIVNTAQAAVDTARASAAAAAAAYTSDQKNGASATTLASDASALAQANAKLAVAQQALARSESTAQVVAAGATQGSIVATTPVAAGTTITAPTWTGPSAISLPDKFGAVSFVVNDNFSYDANGLPTGAVSLAAAQWDTNTVEGTVPAPGTSDELETNVVPTAQPTFQTTSTALGPPSLLPPDQVVPVSTKTATFYFDRPVKNMALPKVTSGTPPVPQTATVNLSSDGKTVTVDITSLKPGKYQLSMSVSYVADSKGYTMNAMPSINFSVQ